LHIERKECLKDAKRETDKVHSRLFKNRKKQTNMASEGIRITAVFPYHLYFKVIISAIYFTSFPGKTVLTHQITLNKQKVVIILISSEKIDNSD
jgi:hypothetical protein